MIDRQYLDAMRAAAEQEHRSALAKMHQAQGAVAMIDVMTKELESEKEDAT